MGSSGWRDYMLYLSRFALMFPCGWVYVCGGVDAVAGDKSPVLWNALILKFCPLPWPLKALTDFLVVSSKNSGSWTRDLLWYNHVAFVMPQRRVEFVSCSFWVSFPNLGKCKMLSALLYWYITVLGDVFSKVLPYCLACFSGMQSDGC